MKWMVILTVVALSGCVVAVSDEGVSGSVLFDTSGPTGASVGVDL